MRRPQRLVSAAVLVAFAGALSGCGSNFGGGFDPTDLLDWLDTKKKLPGERKPVFPEGVPGLEQGVPKDLYKGNAEKQQQPNQQGAAAPPAEEPKKKQAKSKTKKEPAAADATQQGAAAPDAEAAPEEDTTPAAPPPPAKKIVRKRTTAPPPDNAIAPQAQPAPSAQSAQQSSPPFPAPLPSGTFTR
jgi:hypothetical protein